MSNTDHLILYLCLFISFIIWGKYVDTIKNDVKYWMFALIPILLYSFITGSRYKWGPDYLSYKYRLQYALKFPEEQLGFRWLNQTIKLLDIDYVGGFIVYSLIFMTSAFVLIHSYKKVSSSMYYFVIPATLIFATSAIRQGLALSFVFLALHFLNKKQWLGIVLCVLIGSSIHTATLITFTFIGAGYLFLNKNLISWKITIPLYLFFTFFYNPSSIGFISGYLSKYIILDNSFQGYIDNSDDWFGKDAAKDIYEQSFFASVTSSLFYISIIYLGYVALKFKLHAKIIFIYNLLVIGIILYRVVFTFEILRRIAEPLVMLYFIVLGYAFFIIYNVKIKKQYQDLIDKNNSYNKLFPNYKIFMTFIIFYLVLFFGRFIFLNPTAIFYWNK